jgi:hypothetical protein
MAGGAGGKQWKQLTFGPLDGGSVSHQPFGAESIWA